MPYRLEQYSVPEEVPPGDSFDIFVEVFCEEEEGIAFGREEGCSEKNVEVNINEARATGPLGFWKFPVLNMVVGRDTVATPIDDNIALAEGTDTTFRGTVTIDRPGEYEAILTLGGIKETKEISIQR